MQDVREWWLQLAINGKALIYYSFFNFGKLLQFFLSVIWEMMVCLGLVLPSWLSQQLLLPVACVATSWCGTLTSEIATWDPSWEQILCMHEGFGVTVDSPMLYCRLAPGTAKAVRLLFQAPTAVWGQYDGGGGL